jgi:hypothetical protein
MGFLFFIFLFLFYYFIIFILSAVCIPAFDLYDNNICQQM